MPAKEKARESCGPIPNDVLPDTSGYTALKQQLQASRLVRLYAVNSAMAETLAPLVFLEAMR